MMGADFLFAITEVPVDENNNFLSLEEQLDRLRTFVSCQSDDWAGFDYLEELAVFDYHDSLREEYIETMTDALKYVNAEYRDTAIIQLKDTYYWLSGGLSYGDEPTEACNHIWHLCWLPDNWWNYITVEPL
jgi:hypothetical protein